MVHLGIWKSLVMYPVHYHCVIHLVATDVIVLYVVYCVIKTVKKGTCHKQSVCLSVCLLPCVQDTPAAKRPPPLGQLRCFPWWRHWSRVSSVPEHLTPLMTTASADGSPCQYHVSWEGPPPNQGQ